MKEKIKILLVDDHPAMLIGLTGVLKNEKQIEIIGEASDGDEAIEEARNLNPDVVILDLALPKKSGIEVISAIRSFSTTTKILVYSSYSDNENIFTAMSAGAKGYLLKDCLINEIVNAIQDVYLGKPALSLLVQSKIVNQMQKLLKYDHAAKNILSTRELEILRWLAKGLTNSQISEKIFISEGTVRTHIRNITNKLGLNNRTETIVYAVRNGIVKEEE